MPEAVQIRRFVPDDAGAVIALWQACGLTRPWNDPQRDIARKLAQQAEGFLVAVQDARIVGSVMAGYDGHRGWVNYLAADPALRHQGLGRQLMAAAEAYVASLGAPKMNLQLREDNTGAALFYERLGYRRDAVLSYGKRLVLDGAAPPPAPLAQTLVLASRNQKKLAELQALLAPRGYALRLVSEFSDEDVEETGESFIENALLKARHAARVSGLPALADDSGLEVAALGGAPGVRSARYAAERASDAANNEKLLHALAGLPEAQRSARFVSVLVLLRHAQDPVPLIAQGFWPGRILEAAQGANGFGYDPLFYVPELARSAAELPAELKNRVSHRARAMHSLLRQLPA
ncbi:non-canonical purine NTP pyrophosphatase, RdgB/HAM1 family [Solimonas aquatica]|uniref:dITP/XTP pyrophosphatase n=1 Tax=Solimonas aquatica TaxID=489703 RepID=A0A1H9J5U6_9GAMM|nr:GNAT family acetyltransferase [Solimonas aquatica]SEQ82254.1 non-canonical purine NTP pyrophosphatase, RdgB/HAM1 family [Solimonas aquatica]